MEKGALPLVEDGFDMDELFVAADEEHTVKPYNYADQVMETLEKEYLRPRMEMNEREKEKEDLQLKMAALVKKLRQNKNIKVHRASINQTRAETRKKIKAEMEHVKDRLYQIELEEKGAEVTSKNLVDATIDQKLKHAS